MEKGWSELSAPPPPTSLEDAIYYPEYMRLTMDFTKAITWNNGPDMSDEPTPQQEVLLAQEHCMWWAW